VRVTQITGCDDGKTQGVRATPCLPHPWQAYFALKSASERSCWVHSVVMPAGGTLVAPPGATPWWTTGCCCHAISHRGWGEGEPPNWPVLQLLRW